VDLDKLRELIEILEASQLAELEIEEDGRRIRLQKPAPPSVVAAYPGAAGPLHPPALPVGPAAGGLPSAHGEGPAGHDTQIDEGLDTIDSPMVGVFYVAPAPGEPPFVNPGDTVEEGQTVCIVEAMKLMNEVAAKAPAVIEKVLVENAEPVEFGQPLFAVRPLG